MSLAGGRQRGDTDISFSIVPNGSWILNYYDYYKSFILYTVFVSFVKQQNKQKKKAKM